MKFFFSQPIALALVLTTLASCSYKSKTADSSTSPTATFLANKQSASQQLPDVFDNPNTIWRDFPNKRMVTFRTCLNDAMLPGASVAFEKFVVQGGEKEIALTPTDQTGCFEWSEPITFNYLANEHYMYVDRKIVAKGHYRGSVDVTMLVNPWSVKAIDTRYGINNIEPGILTVPSRQESKALFNTFLPGNLKIDGITANLEYYNTSMVKGVPQTNVRFNLSVSSIRYYRKGLQGEPQFSKINTGKFDIKLYLFEGKIDEQNNKNVIVHSLLGKASVSDVGIINEKSVLNAIADMTLTRAPGSNSTLYFGIRIEPSKKSNPPKGLGFDQNVAILGGYRMGRGPISASPSNITYLNNIPDLAALESMSFGVEDEFNSPYPLGFFIDALSMSTPGAFFETNTNSPKRTYNVPFSFCLRDTLTRDGIQQVAVYYQVGPQGEEAEWQGPIVLNSTGCTRTTTFPVTYNLYDANKYVPFLLKVRVAEAPYKDVVQENPFYLNPWGSFQTFFIDNQKFSGAKSVVPNPLPLNNPDLVLENIKATFVGNNIDVIKSTGKANKPYELNKYMQLKVTKGFQFQFDPKVKFYHMLTGDQSGFAPFMNGKLNVEAYILVRRDAREIIDPRDIDLKEYRLVSVATNSDVTVDRSTTPNAPLDFKINFNDIPQSGLRSLIVVKIKPSKEFETLNGMAYASFFDLSSSGGSHQTWRLSWTDKYTDKRLNTVSLKLIEKDLNSLVAEKKLSDDRLNAPMSSATLAKLGIAAGDEARSMFIDRVKTNLKLQNNCQGEALLSTPNCAVQVKVEDKKTFSTKYNLDLEKISPLWFNNMFKTEISGSSSGQVFDAVKELCRVVVDPRDSSNVMSDCRNNISKYMDIVPSRHVVKMNTNPQFVNAMDYSLSVGESRGFNVGRSMSFSQSFSYGVSASLGYKFENVPLIGALGPGVGANASLSKSISESTSQGDSYGFGASISRGVSVDALMLSFNATVQKCILVKPKAYSVGYGSSTSFRPVMNAYHICDSDLKTEDFVETWYFVGISETPDRFLRDGFTLDQNTYVQIFRGDRMFSQFLNYIQSKNVSFTISLYSDLMNMTLEQVNQKYTDQIRKLGETIDVPRMMFSDNNFPGILDSCASASLLDAPGYCQRRNRNTR